MNRRSQQPWQAAIEFRRALNNDFIEVRGADARGRGVFATRPFKNGDPICGFPGRPVTPEEAKRVLLVDPVAQDYMMYCPAPGSARLIVPDPEMPGGHLANHSCNPNAACVSLRGEPALVARREIASGEEICIFYGWTLKDKGPVPCLCGSTHCTGYVDLPRSPSRDDGSYGVAGVPRLMQVGARNRNEHVAGCLHRLVAMGVVPRPQSLSWLAAQLTEAFGSPLHPDAQWLLSVLGIPAERLPRPMRAA